MLSRRVTEYCCEDPSTIENYELALNDGDTIWVVHHRLEIQDDKVYSCEDLIKLGLYYNRPASELIFMHPADHKSLHGKVENQKKETSIKRGNHHKGNKGWNKPKPYLDEDGNTVYMRPSLVSRWHKNWIKLEE